MPAPPLGRVGRQRDLAKMASRARSTTSSLVDVPVQRRCAHTPAVGEPPDRQTRHAAVVQQCDGRVDDPLLRQRWTGPPGSLRAQPDIRHGGQSRPARTMVEPSIALFDDARRPQSRQLPPPGRTSTTGRRFVSPYKDPGAEGGTRPRSGAREKRSAGPQRCGLRPRGNPSRCRRMMPSGRAGAPVGGPRSP